MSISSTDIVVPVGQRLDKPVFGVRTPGDSDRVEKGDFARALNPLHYIPGVSQVYESSTGNKGSSAMKIIGAAVLGGPLGLIAGVANAIFEQQTGHSVVGAVASAFSGEEPATQVAAAKVETEVEPIEVASLQTQITPLAQGHVASTEALKSAQAEIAAQDAQMKMAAALSASTDMGDDTDAQVLSLFGGQTASAHQSYKKAQMMSYFTDVTNSHVI